jgi:hypothetical protein
MTNLDTPSRATPQAQNRSAALPRDDRILPEVRWVAAPVVPVLIAAAIILYLFPDKTRELFAWTIQPTMSALLMGAGYAAGAYFFIRVFLARRWHHVGAYFLPIALFTTCQGIATILFWDRFNHGHPSFWAWAFLYFTTPFLIPFLWWRNRGTDPGTPDPDDVVVPAPVRWVALGIGSLLLLLAAALILFADALIPQWPWQLNVLTARATGGWISAPGLVYLLLARDSRWSAWRIILQHQALAVGLILLAAARAWGEFNAANPVTWFFVGGLAGNLVAILALLFVFDRARRPATQQAIGDA